MEKKRNTLHGEGKRFVKEKKTQTRSAFLDMFWYIMMGSRTTHTGPQAKKLQKRHFSFPGTFKSSELHRSHFKSANTIMFTI